MNLAAYDSMIDNFTDHTYIDEYYRTMYSMDIEFRTNYCFLSKYNSETKATDIFICMSDEREDGYKWFLTTKTKIGRVKIDLKPIWNNLPLKAIDFNQRTPIKEVDRQEDCIIYKLDF